MRVVALVGWLVIVGLFLTWQGLALVYAPEWPTMSQLFRDFMEPFAGRIIMLGLWLWLGWHLVVRAWRGPRESPPRRPSPREIPWTVVGGYLVFLAIVAVFHVGLAGQRGALRSAATGGAFLLAGATLVYAALLWRL